MSSRGTRNGSKVLLSLCHKVDVLSERIRASSRKGPRQLETRRRHAVTRLRTALHQPGRDRFRTTLRMLRKEHALEETAILVVLLLFNRRIRRANPTMSGRELIESVSRGGAHALEVAPMLHPQNALLKHGLVTAAIGGAEDVFDSEFRIAESTYRTLYRAFHGIDAGETAEQSLAVPYGNTLEHLLDCRLLVEMARRRAARLFPQSYWAEVHPDEDRPVDELNDMVSRLAAAIALREQSTTNRDQLPIIRLRQEFSLSPDEELMVMGLLVQELFTARPALDLGELVRLVAASEVDVIRKLALVSPEGKLRHDGLITVESETDRKDLLSTAWLSPQTAARLLAGADLKGAIGTDERTRFREFLDRLRGSDDFFRQM